MDIKNNYNNNTEIDDLLTDCNEISYRSYKGFKIKLRLFHNGRYNTGGLPKQT